MARVKHNINVAPVAIFLRVTWVDALIVVLGISLKRD